MKCPFFIFVVFAAVVQYSVAIQSTTPTQIQAAMMTDYSKISAFKRIAHLEYQKVVDIIFNSMADFANVVCGNQDPPQGNLSTPNISKAELSTSLIIQFDSIYFASLINNPKIYIPSPIIQAAAITEINNIVANLVEGILLGQCTNSSGCLSEIEILENKTLTGFAGVNAIIYTIFFPTYEIHLSKSESVIARARQQSDAQLRNAVRNIFDTIKSSCRSVCNVIESARHQVSIAFKTVVEITFGLIYKFLFALSVIQNGIVNDSSVVQAIREATTSDYEKTVNSMHTMMQDGSTNVTPQCKSDIMADSAAIDKAQETARYGINMAISFIFATINITFANIADGKQCGFEGDDSITNIAARKEFIVFKTAIDSYFNTTLLVEPRAISAINSVRNETYCFIMKTVEGVQKAIEFAEKENSTQISVDIESVEEATIFVANVVTKDIFIPIINASQYQPQTTPAIKRLLEETYFAIEKAYRSIFFAIKILLAEAFPEYRIEGENCFASIGAAQADTISAYMEAVDNIITAIRILFTAFLKNQTEMVEDFCSCAY